MVFLSTLNYNARSTTHQISKLQVVTSQKTVVSYLGLLAFVSYTSRDGQSLSYGTAGTEFAEDMINGSVLNYSYLYRVYDVARQLVLHRYR